MHLWFFLFIILIALYGVMDLLNSFAGSAFSADPSVSQMIWEQILTQLPKMLGG